MYIILTCPNLLAEVVHFTSTEITTLKKVIHNPGRVSPIDHLPEHTLIPMLEFAGGPPIVGCFLCKECFETGVGQPGSVLPGRFQVFETSAQGRTVFSMPGL